MKKIILFSFNFIVAFTALAQERAVITVRTDEDMSRSIGSRHPVTVTVRNNSSSSYVVGKSKFAVVMTYEGSGTIGRAFNLESELKSTLAAGQSKNFTLYIETPKEAGIYPVEVSFKWGNRIISNVVDLDFEIEENYSVNISARTTSFNTSGQGNVEFIIQNTGDMTWPEGDYSLKFNLVKAESGSTREDQRCFEIEPRVVETWEGFEPGNRDNILIRNFRLPKTKGSYRIKVTLLLEGRTFNASGNQKQFTFVLK